MHDAGLTWCNVDSYMNDYMSYNKRVYVPFKGTYFPIESEIHKKYTIHEAKDFIIENNTITLPLVNGVPDISNCGIEMLVSDDGKRWAKANVFCYNENNYSAYMTLSNMHYKHAKPLPKQITKKEAEKLLNNEFEIID